MSEADVRNFVHKVIDLAGISEPERSQMHEIADHVSTGQEWKDLAGSIEKVRRRGSLEEFERLAKGLKK